ncbi:MAG: alpha/beta fold hydrolase [Planctomycetes bacterium]|nr:alpha/beta fold hydrolase [Planctomycetota bacterium]
MEIHDYTSKSFTIAHPEDPARVIRGRVDTPAGANAEKPCPHVIVVHGFKGFMNWGFFPELGARLAAAGYAGVFFNTSSSGVGEDLESFTEVEAFERSTYSKDIEDIERVRAAVEAGSFPGVDATRAAILGHSRGGGEVLIHAAEAGDLRAVVAWAAIPSARRFDDETIERWRETGVLEVSNARTGQVFQIKLDGLLDYEANVERFDIPAATSRIAAPALFVHGTADEAVEFESLSILSEAYGEGAQTLRLEGGGHTFGIRHPMEDTHPDFEEVWAGTRAFLDQHLKAAT